MNKCVVIVDNSNVWIEGKKLSARIKGIKRNGVDDPSWRIDFGNLITTVSEGMEVEKAILVGSRPPKEDSVWNAAKERGFDVIVHNRNGAGKEKAVDTEIVARGTKIICTMETPCTLKLLSGDRDFVPLINIATENNWDTEMWAFTNAFNKYGELAQIVTHIKPLDDVFPKIGRYDFNWPVEN